LPSVVVEADKLVPIPLELVRASLRKHAQPANVRVALFDHLILPPAALVLPPAAYNALETFLFLGYWPSLRNPQTFNEKLLWRKLYDDNPLYPLVTDKYRVRDFVAERVGRQALTKLLHVTDDPATIPFSSLPDSYVVKANFGAGRNIFVRDGKRVSEKEIVGRCQSWMREKRNGRHDRWKYHDMPRLILVEEMLDCGGREFPVDFKFYVFHGRIRMMEIATQWNGKIRRNLYDEDRQPLDVVWKDRRDRFDEAEFPPGFDEMRRVAEVLAVGFDFVSVDLYLARDVCLFGEISLFPEGGTGRFVPRSFDRELGSYWQLDTGVDQGRGSA
jgi:hypothetical protein